MSFELSPSFRVSVGQWIDVDGISSPRQLMAESWDKAKFRLAMFSNGPIESVAVNVAITGRIERYRSGSYWIRCKVVFVGDGSPDTTSRGWLRTT